MPTVLEVNDELYYRKPLELVTGRAAPRKRLPTFNARMPFTIPIIVHRGYCLGKASAVAN